MYLKEPWVSNHNHSCKASESTLAFIKSQGYHEKPTSELWCVIHQLFEENNKLKKHNQSLMKDNLKLYHVARQCEQTLSLALDRFKR